MFVRVLFAVFCLKLFLGGANGDPCSPLTTTLQYESSSYSCDAGDSKALLSVVANRGSVQKPLVSLTSVIDLSGSMAGRKMTLLRETNLYLIEKLAESGVDHKFGVVTFSENAEEPIQLDTLTPSAAAAAKEEIKKVSQSGYTDLWAGLEKGIRQQTADSKTDKYIRAVFLFTDGKPNRGVHDTNQIIKNAKKLVKDASDDGHTILIYTFSVGDRVDVNLLAGIANAGGGLMYSVRTAVDVPKAFGSAVAGNCCNLH